METSAFHFADNAWLWGLLIVAIAALFYILIYKPSASGASLEKFADKHLLPHLIKGDADETKNNVVHSLLLWSIIWSLGVLAMAGPRWNYTDVETFAPARDLVILLDLSKSMDAADVKPSRLILAREQVEDLIRLSPGVNIGLIGYTGDAHMVSPITDDTKSVSDILPYLDTSVPYIAGDNINLALKLAATMLAAEPGNNKSILILSDGNFSDGDVSKALDETTGKGITVDALALGTDAGAPVPDGNGGWVKDQSGKIAISRLQTSNLKQLSAKTGGIYAKADYTDSGIKAILSRINSKDNGAAASGKKIRNWEEHFYLPVLLMAILILPWFRKGKVFLSLALLAMLTFSPGNSKAAGLEDLFLNKQQQAARSFEKGDYKNAEALFDTPYSKGVSEYKAGEYGKAEKSFAESPDSSAKYNLANAEALNGKYEDAIANYESVLKTEPNNKNAKHNLEVVKKWLEQKKQQQDKNQQSDKNKTGGEKNGQQQNSGDKSGNQSSAGQQSSPQGKQDEKNSGKGNNSDKNGQQNSQSGQQGKEQQNGSPQNSAGQNQPMQPGNDQQNQQPQNAGQNPETSNKESRANNPATEKEQQINAGNNPNQSMMSGQEHQRTQKDIDADQWLNRIDNDPKSFLKNQFMIESEMNGAKGDER